MGILASVRCSFVSFGGRKAAEAGLSWIRRALRMVIGRSLSTRVSCCDWAPGWRVADEEDECAVLFVLEGKMEVECAPKRLPELKLGIV